MFTIIGGDGKEYGPATAEQLRAWITAGRANLDTKAKAVGSEEWRRLGDFPEFAGPSAPPPIGGVPVAAAPSAAAPVVVPVDPNLADRGRRFGARVIDWVIQSVCAIPGVAILGTEVIKIAVMAARGEEPDFEQMDIHRLILGCSILFAAWLALLVVQVWLLSTRGQSIGKLIVGIRVVKFPDGAKAGFVHAWLIREAAITAIGIVLGFVPFLGMVFHLTDWCFIFRNDQRCLHDLMAGTKVVRAAPAGGG